MRHRQRHVHATIVGHLIDTLTNVGWVNAPLNFGTTPVKVIDYEPQAAGETPAFNTVAVSIDHEGENQEYELGGITMRSYTLFVDVYAELEPIGIALADDIKDSLEDVGLSVLDFTTSPAVVSDEWLEFENVIAEAIPSPVGGGMDKRSWRAVKATAICYF